MKNQTKITYHGLVEITTKNKDGKIRSIKKYNLGTDVLFKMFTQALLGRNTAEYIPSKVLLRKSESQEEIIQGTTLPISGLVETVLVLPETESETESKHSCVKLTAFIPYVSGIEGARYIYLLRSSLSELELAYTEITSDGETLQISAGLSLLINWYLYLDNN